jgi:hypothetical protein
LRYVAQLDPFALQVTVAPDEGQRPHSLITLWPEDLPDRGRVLKAACDAFAAGILAGLPDRAVGRVLAAAGRETTAGLVALLDPNDQGAILIQPVPGRSLGEGIVLGALLDAPETVH